MSDKQPMIKLVANVCHAKDAVVARAAEFRDLAMLPTSPEAERAALEKARELCSAVDAMRTAKKLAGM